MEEKHRIYEIAEKLIFPKVEIWKRDDRFMASLEMPIADSPKATVSLAWTSSYDTETEALDALLSKLQSIVCPDYERYVKDYDSHEAEMAKLGNENFKLKQENEKLKKEREESTIYALGVKAGHKRGFEDARAQVEKREHDDYYETDKYPTYQDWEKEKRNENT